MGRRWRRDGVSGMLGCERGQALVEAAIAIPVLLVLVFGVVAVGRVVQAKIAVQAAAREAGRTLAVAPSEHEGVTDALEAAHAIASGYGLSEERLTIDVDANGFLRGGRATADVTYSVSLSGLPLLGFVDVEVSAHHSEQIGPYRSREVAHR